MFIIDVALKKAFHSCDTLIKAKLSCAGKTYYKMLVNKVLLVVILILSFQLLQVTIAGENITVTIIVVVLVRQLEYKHSKRSSTADQI